MEGDTMTQENKVYLEAEFLNYEAGGMTSSNPDQDRIPVIVLIVISMVLGTLAILLNSIVVMFYWKKLPSTIPSKSKTLKVKLRLI